MKNNRTQVEYTAYGTEYQVCLPLDLEKIIPSNDPVRLLNAVLEEMDYRKLTATYSRLGRIAYSPRLLFKVVLYAYTRGIYSAQKEKQAVVFVYGKGHRKTGIQRAIETINGWLARLKRYNLDIHICGERNSYSKTDRDATFMHMKEDHMRNGQLKPGYNVNVATASAYIIGNYISADRTDTKAFIPFLEKLCKKHPVKRVVVDSGYESEENYHYVDGSKQLSLFVKPSNHEQRKTRKYKTDIGRRENMPYDEERDEYTCAQGRKLSAVYTKSRKTETGYVQEVTVYECSDCKGCPVKEKCIRQKKTDKVPLTERTKRLNVSKYFAKQRHAMEEKISTEEGILLRINRSIQAEGVFAVVKEDMNFRRFMLRGKANVTVEWNMVSMAYNIMKLHHKIQTGRLGNHLIAPKTA